MCDMRKLHQRNPFNHNQLNLLDRITESELRANNPAARRIADRYGVPIHTAALLARAAGLGPENMR
jgi:hypothetical protein